MLFLMEIYFATSQPDSPIVGVSDIDHGYYRPETGDRAWGLNPGPIKISCCMVWGSNP
jgi:hypothetical protein